MTIERGGLNHAIAIIDGNIAGCFAFEGKRFDAGYRLTPVL